ncbi:hypothetical protein [Emticicia agri]|uniref:Glycosyltransferase RgtA/B/C/D-like domain-containing protein n=1 Tax=Emticicia agri TaxID=2492393 RepID=A0A4Q5M623_9BACT|nr:hypothetical protein [Emticicia agri]RYU97433.1 hypothetical protein EWM59_01720 [Emticicia agri]
MYWIFLLLFLLFIWQIHRNAAYISESLSDYGLKWFLGLVSCIIPTGFFLAKLNLINQPVYWGASANVIATLFHVLFRQIANNHHFNLQTGFQGLQQKLATNWLNQPVLNKVSFGILLLAVFITAIINLIISFVTFPNEWDSMTGHLVKCAYYLQNGNMDRLQGTTWTIDFYPNSLPTLQLFFYHVLGEKGFKVIHYLSYWFFALSSYGIAYKISKNFIASLFVGLITLLLPTALVQATTTETDIVLSAYLGILAYTLFSFKQKPTPLNIILIALIAGVWIGHKVTFLLIAPAAFAVAIYTVLRKKEFYKNINLFVSSFLISIAIYVLPTGYIGNIKEVGKFSLGSLSAPPMVMKWHGVEEYTGKEKIKNIALNIGRYSSDFLNLDGLRSTDIGKKINDIFRYIPDKILGSLPIEGEKFTVVSYFSFDHPIRFYIERPYWGIISFGMVLPVALILFYHAIRNYRTITTIQKSLLILVAASLLHFLSLSYSAPYDPIKARYFLNMAVWCMPLLAAFYVLSEKHKIWQYWQLLCCLVVGVSAVCSILFTRVHPIFTERNIFNMSRMEQVTIARPDIYEAYKRFDELVPKNAIVALGTQQEHEDFEYPLWGEEFKRKLIPIHPFRSRVKPIPAEAEYLFYSKGVLPYQQGDIALGIGDEHNDTPVEESAFFLRKLNPQTVKTK